MQLTINNITVELQQHGGKAFATSLDVAKVFEKEHYNILETIKALPQDNFIDLNFQVKYYISKNNKQMPMYEMTRDGFSLLVMGFTGAKAYQWKIKFIEGFNKLEEIIRNQQFQLPTNYVEALEALVNTEKEKQKALAQLEQARPRIEFADRLQKSEGTISIRDFAKILCDKSFPIGQNRLFDLLREKGFLDRLNKPYQNFVDMGIFVLKEATYPNPATQDNIIYTQVRITAKGQEYLYKKLTEKAA